MSKFISNSFSINILPLLELGIVRVKKISPDMIPKDVESAIGHEDTARVVSGILGFEVKPNPGQHQADRERRLVRCSVHWTETPGGCNDIAERSKHRVFRG